MHAWEKGFERTWDGVKEDEHGNLQAEAEAELRLSRQRRASAAAGAATGALRRGMIRYVYVAVDMSASMQEQDMRPSRLAVTQRVVNEFVDRYFDQNPLSQLGLLVTRDGRAERITEMSGNPRTHMEALKSISTTHGEASLQNVLELASAALAAVPDYGSREIIILYGALSTCDPGDIHVTIGNLKKRLIRVSIVGFGAEMFICRTIAEETAGDYTVALDERHFEDALLAQTTPPLTLARRGPLFADMVQMGFPRRQDLYPSIGYSGREQVLTVTGYLCPRCKSKTTELPSTCVVCLLPLVSAPHLARSYHHLFPVPPFTEVRPDGAVTAAAAAAAAAAAEGGNPPIGGGGDADAGNGAQLIASGGAGVAGANGMAAVVAAAGAAGSGRAAGCCDGCLRDLRGTTCHYVCPDCSSTFCIECDMYIHDSLHNCPGCS
ncbi:unnamed protein product [Phaeothamnion confervicola]